MAPQSLEKLKGDLRELTRRHGGQSLEQVISAGNEKLTGWIQYLSLLGQGNIWCVDLDFKGYFDTISHQRLKDLIRQRIVDGSVLALLE